MTAKPVGIDVYDSRRGVDALSRNAELCSRERYRGRIQVIERHRHERRGYLFTGGKKRIKLTAIGRVTGLIRQLDQIVSRITHRRNNSDYRIAFGCAGDDTRHVFYAGNGLN